MKKPSNPWFATLIYALVLGAVSAILIVVPYTKSFITLPALLLQEPMTLFFTSAGIPLYLAAVAIFAFIDRKIRRDAATRSTTYLAGTAFIVATGLSLCAAMVSSIIFWSVYKHVIIPTLDPSAGGAIMIAFMVAVPVYVIEAFVYLIIGNILGVIYNLYTLRELKHEVLPTTTPASAKSFSLSRLVSEPLLVLLGSVLVGQAGTMVFEKSVGTAVALVALSIILLIVGCVLFLKKNKQAVE